MPETIFINLHYILAGAWRRRYLIAVPILVMPIIGGLVGGLAPKKYENHTTILIQETAKLNPFMEDLSVSTNLKERMAALKSLLHSRHMLLDVAEEMGLISKDTREEDKEWHIARLSAAIGVSMSGNDLVKLTLSGSHPEGMKKTLEKIKERFINNLLAPEKSSINSSEQFLTEQLDINRRNLLNAEHALADFKTKNAGSLPELYSGNVSRLRQLQERIAERKTELAGAIAERDSLWSRISQTNPVVGKLEEHIVSILGDLALLRSRYTDEHSKVQAALHQLRRLQEERSRLIRSPSEGREVQRPEGEEMERLWNLASTMGDQGSDAANQPLLVSQLQELQTARSKVEKLQQEVASMEQLAQGLNDKVVSYGHTDRELAELDRDLNIKRKLYEDLLNRYEMARVTGALGRFEGPERIKVIDRPYTPTHATNPPVILFVIVGLIGGIMLGAGMALLAEIADTSVRRRDVLERLTGVPVLSRVPPLG